LKNPILNYYFFALSV